MNTNKMITDGDVFHTRVKDRIRAQIRSTKIIT